MNAPRTTCPPEILKWTYPAFLEEMRRWQTERELDELTTPFVPYYCVQEATMIDLKPFCSTEKWRPYLHNPFSQGEFTYATNGHVIVRVPRRDDVPEKSGTDRKSANYAPDCAALIARYPLPSEAVALPTAKLPTAEKVECESCGGWGVEHDCPDCSCKCHECDGSGEYERSVSVGINGGWFALRYIRMLAVLPGVKVASPRAGKEEDPRWFTFEGGDALLMPLRSQYLMHIELLP